MEILLFCLWTYCRQIQQGETYSFSLTFFSVIIWIIMKSVYSPAWKKRICHNKTGSKSWPAIKSSLAKGRRWKSLKKQDGRRGGGLSWGNWHWVRGSACGFGLDVWWDWPSVAGAHPWLPVPGSHPLHQESTERETASNYRILREYMMVGCIWYTIN